MEKFLELEGGYLGIGLFILLATIFVTTRPFVGGGKAWKKGVPFVLFGVAGFILSHYFVTTSRMDDVKTRFQNGNPVICENRAIRKVAQSIIIDPKKPQGWVLEGDVFKSPEYSRAFHSARCLEYHYPAHINGSQEDSKAAPK